MEVSHVNFGILFRHLGWLNVSRMHLKLGAIENHFLIVYEVVDPDLSGCLHLSFSLLGDLHG